MILAWASPLNQFMLPRYRVEYLTFVTTLYVLLVNDTLYYYHPQHYNKIFNLLPLSFPTRTDFKSI